MAPDEELNDALKGGPAERAGGKAFYRFTPGVPDAVKPLAGWLAARLPFLFRAYELRAAWRFPAPPALGPDGLPMPGRLRMMRVTGHGEWRSFFDAGQRIAQAFEAILAEQGHSLATLPRVLDLGCGCGRLARHWAGRERMVLFGCDIDAAAVRWCQQNLPGDYAVNRVQPPAPYAEHSFDLVVAFSVFTHLKEATQRAWLDELARLLAPGGLALITFHDEFQISLGAVDNERALRDGFSVRREGMEGSNLPSVQQSHDYMRAMAGERFDVLATYRSCDMPFAQAVAVLQRRA
ncbi:MAG: class I SAM-dependent methyltransferase [Pseudomonadota bacterium]